MVPPTTNSVDLVYFSVAPCLDLLTACSEEEGEGLVGLLYCLSVSVTDV